VEGMVAYRDTYEIPAVTIMDFVEGPNLTDAINSNFLQTWEDRIEVALKLARIIRSAHTLPERVLHRDIRPANVMLRNYYAEPELLDVVVLDFDLSWHIGEKSVSFIPSKHGYLAPEQIGLLPQTSTRSAAVDSFGFGMTLFFICSGRDPGLNEHVSGDWEEKVVAATRSPNYKKWLSLNRRIARLILSATKNRQFERWDMGQIEAELERLNSIIANPAKVRAADLWTEEIAAHIELDTSYSWDEDARTAILQLRSGVNIRLRADETERKIKLVIEWLDVGTATRKNVDRYLPKTTMQAAALLRAGRFSVQTNVARKTALLEAQLNVSDARDYLKEVAQAIEQAAKQYAFA
jgi:eukaryotic-like serine/threonine-protein kinase